MAHVSSSPSRQSRSWRPGSSHEIGRNAGASRSHEGSSLGLNLFDQRVSFRERNIAHTRSGPAHDMATTSLPIHPPYPGAGRPRSASSATHASSAAPSISGWATSLPPVAPAQSKRNSFFGALSVSRLGSSSTSVVLKKARVLPPPAPPPPDLYEDVIEISAGPTAEELEREQLRMAAAQAVGLRRTPPSPPMQSSLPLYAYPIPPFPSTATLLAQRATMAAAISKRMPGTNFLGRTQWKRRLAMLTPRNVHILTAQEEIERLALSFETVAYVADDEPGMGGRRSVIKLGTEELWWILQMRDAEQMQSWLQALKTAILALKPSASDTASSHRDPLPTLRVVPTSPATSTFHFDSASSASSPSSSTRLSRAHSVNPSAPSAAALKSLLSSRLSTSSRQRSASELSSPSVAAPPVVTPPVNMAANIGRRIIDTDSLPPDSPDTPVAPVSASNLPIASPRVEHHHSDSLPPPPRPPRRPLSSSSSPIPPPLQEAQAEALARTLAAAVIPEISHPASPPTPEANLSDRSSSNSRPNRTSLISNTSTPDSNETEGPTMKHPFGAPTSNSKRDKRLSTSSALSAGSNTSGGSGSVRVLRTTGNGVVPPQRPAPVGALPPTPFSGRPPSLPASLPPTGPLPLPPVATPPRQSLDLSDLVGKRSSVPVGISGLSSLSNVTTGATTSRRAARMSMPLPPTLPPSGPLPLPPAHGRARSSVMFAQPIDQRAAALRDLTSGSSLSRTSSLTRSIPEEDTPGSQQSPPAESGNRRKRVSLRLRFSKSSVSSDVPATPPPEIKTIAEVSKPVKAAASRPTEWERGISFISPDTPADELQSFMSFSPTSPPPLPSPAIDDLFTAPPGHHMLAPPPLYPPPEQPKFAQQHPIPANDLFSSVLVPAPILGRARAASVSTLDVEPPAPPSLSPPPPRRAERKRASTVSERSKRASIGSINSPRKSGDRPRGSADSGIVINNNSGSRPSSAPHEEAGTEAVASITSMDNDLTLP